MVRLAVPNSIADSGWILNNKTSIPHRGILDFDRTVTFTSPLSNEELDNVCEWLRTNQCPGWTGVRVHHEYTRRCDPGTYVFYTTHDSSD